MSDLPLAGLRIISLEQFGAAPYCTMFLADLGADVLKVESGEGDFARRTGPQTLGPGDSLYYQTFNLNKKSVAIDLKAAEDRDFFHALVGESHAVLNNLRGNLPGKLGLDYPALSRVNPAIVCGHISAYGRTGSRAAWPGYDFLMQAEAGFMMLTGEPGTTPARVGLSMVDYMTGMMMALGLVSAIRRAERDGIGCDVDVSLFDAALHQLAYQGSWCMNEGIETPRLMRSSHPTTTPVQLYRAEDGWVFVCCMTDRFWEILIERIGRPELAADARFRDLDQRLVHRDALTDVLDAVFGGRPVAYWMELLAGHIPVAPVNGLDQALANPFVTEAEMIVDLPHGSGRTLRMLANPLRLDGRRLPQRVAPRLDAEGPALRAAVRDAVA